MEYGIPGKRGGLRKNMIVNKECMNLNFDFNFDHTSTNILKIREEHFIQEARNEPKD